MKADHAIERMYCSPGATPPKSVVVPVAGSYAKRRAPGQQVGVTVSLGGAFAPQWVRSSAPLWIDRADQQLYRAKSEGRNRACLEQPTVSLVSAEEKGLLFGTSQFAESP